MDGKFKTFTLQGLAVDSNPQQLIESLFVETSFGVNDAEYFQLCGEKEYIVAGLDDGTLQVYDYGANNKQSYQKPVFRVQKNTAGQQAAATELDNPYDIFTESLFEHSDAVTKVEKNPIDSSIFLSSGKDSQVNVWRFADSASPLEFHYDISKSQLKQDGLVKAGAVTAAKWLDEQVIIMTLSDGTVQWKDIRTKKTDKAGLLIPRTDCAIWDLALWQSSVGLNPIIAEDSGKIRMIDPRNNNSSIIITVRIIINCLLTLCVCVGGNQGVSTVRKHFSQLIDCGL